MKKFLCIIFALTVAFSLGACTGSAVPLSVDNPPPWSNANTETAYEKTVYSIKKVDNASNEVIAEGTLTYVLEFDHKGENNNFNYSRLTMDMSVTYNDKAPEVDRGKTDTLHSKVIFQSDALVPQYSEKTVSLALRSGVNDNSYTLKNDYSTQKSELSMAGKEPSVIDFTGKSFVNVYDNEMLYYVVRSFSDIKAGGSNTFTLANFFDMHVKNKFSTYSMRFTCGEEGSEETVYLPFKGTFLDEQGSATVLKVSVSINESLSGPPTELYYSMTPFKTGENTTTKKVLVSFKTYEYNLSTNDLKYTTEYSITDYSVTP